MRQFIDDYGGFLFVMVLAAIALIGSSLDAKGEPQYEPIRITDGVPVFEPVPTEDGWDTVVCYRQRTVLFRAGELE